VMDGYALCREWKSDDTLKHIPLVFYTATYTEPKDEEFALSLGADRFIIKPQEPNIFMNMLKDVLEEKYTARQAVTKPLGEEMESFRRHNEILFKKLEKKMSDLEIANQKLRISEEMYRLSFENATDVIYTIDADLHVLTVSPSVERILGYKPQDFIGRPVSALGYIRTPESFEEIIGDIGLILKGEVIPATIYQFIAKDGTIKYGEVSGSPLMREGKIMGIISVARDITERKRAEEKVTKSEKKYRELYDFLPIPVYEMDLEANITSANRAIYEIFGGTEEDLKKGFKVWQILSPEDMVKSSKNIQKLLKGEQIDGTEYTLMRLDGSVFPAIVISSVIYSDGKPVGLRGAIIDITERKKAEEEQRRMNVFLDSILENIPDMIFVKDARDLRLIRFNRAGEDLLGYSRNDLLGKNDYDFFPKEQADSFTGRDRDVLYGKKVVDIPEEPIQTSTKGERILHTKKVPILNVNGEPEYLLGISEDITDRKRAEDSLRKSEARFRSYFELPLVGIAITSPEKGWLEVNDRLSDILGYSIQELKDINWSELTHPEDLDADVEQFNRVLAGEINSYTMDKRFIRKNGDVIWTSLAAGCVRKRDGTVDYFVVILEDITARKESLVRTRRTLGATVHAIAVAVETRDPYTAGHQRRVADLARAIATEMNLPAGQIEGIQMAGIIHDLGKLSVPADILSKPTKLTDLEFGIIKTHAQSGYDILKDIEFPWPIARMVLEHHERMDGSGYPNGLTAKETLLESRILSVADVLEAMASHRPYRPSLGLDAALQEIEKNRGTFYDTDAVDACLKLFREKGYQLQ
jgi:PAS domain S-box-containing protein